VTAITSAIQPARYGGRLQQIVRLVPIIIHQFWGFAARILDITESLSQFMHKTSEVFCGAIP
jgi:hypothetical protein